MPAPNTEQHHPGPWHSSAIHRCWSRLLGDFQKHFRWNYMALCIRWTRTRTLCIRLALCIRGTLWIRRTRTLCIRRTLINFVLKIQDFKDILRGPVILFCFILNLYSPSATIVVFCLFVLLYFNFLPPSATHSHVLTILLHHLNPLPAKQIKILK